RHAQHAAGGPRLGLHGVPLHGRADRVRPDGSDLHESARGAHRGVHHGEVRMKPQRHFEEELDKLKSLLVRMAGMAEEAVRLAVEALRERSAEKAERAIALDDEIDAMELAIDDHAIHLLAPQQPLAKDLRFITMAMQIANDLERVGDHAVNIAQDVGHLIAAPIFPPLPEIDEMVR